MRCNSIPSFSPFIFLLRNCFFLKKMEIVRLSLVSSRPLVPHPLLYVQKLQIEKTNISGILEYFFRHEIHKASSPFYITIIIIVRNVTLQVFVDASTFNLFNDRDGKRDGKRTVV